MPVSKRTFFGLIGSNLWRLERRWWFKRNPYGVYPLAPHSELADRFQMFMFHWQQSYWWPPFWSALFRFDEEYDPKTRGWRVAVLCIPLFAFVWQFRYPAFDSLCVETSMWVSVLPGMPDQGELMKTTYRKVLASTRLLEYRSWEEASLRHGH